MRLNRQTDYVIRVLIFLALSQREALVKQTAIAKNFSIAPEHLTKIISRLSKLEYINTIRGKDNGLRLSLNSLNLTLTSIIKNFEPSFRLIGC